MTMTRKCKGIQAVLTCTAILLCASWASGQQKDSVGTVVQKFKQALDAKDYEGMCSLMTEEDGTQPLKRFNYEHMQQSLQDLVNMWRGNPFQFSDPTFDPRSNNKAFVQVKILNTAQDVKFTLIAFGKSWYIFDIEIYFR